MYCNNYKFLKLYDKGADGRVYLCEKNKIKYLAKTPIKKKEEKISKIMSEIVGPKIYDVFDCNIKELKENGIFMIMEKLQGVDLYRYFDENEDIFIEEDDIIINKLFEKIEKMHTLGYCHNDLFTSNIFLIIKNNKVIDLKIIDFGKSRKKTKDLIYNDYKMLYNYIIENNYLILDRIEPLINILEEKIEELQ